MSNFIIEGDFYMDMFDLIKGIVNNTVDTNKVDNTINKEIGSEVYIVGKANRFGEDISGVTEGYTDETMAAIRVNELSRANENITYGYKKVDILKNENRSNIENDLNVNTLNTSFSLSCKEIRLTISCLEKFLKEEEIAQRQFDNVVSALIYNLEIEDIKKLIDKYKYAQHFSEQYLKKIGGASGKQNKSVEKALSKAGIFNYG